MTQKRYLKIVKLDNVTARIITNHPSIMSDVYHFFSIYIDKYWFHPKVKTGIWDGKIPFVHKNGQFHIGLLKFVYRFVQRNDLVIKIDPELTKRTDISNFEAVTLEWLKPEWIPRQHQVAGALKAIKYRRGILEHATASGKSLTIALIAMHFLITEEVTKCLILVPSLSLIEQMKTDLISYGVPEEWIGRFSGKVKDAKQPIIVSTWQSMCRQKKMTAEFDLLLADECLHPSTLISIADGSKKPISDIEVGDLVVTKNELTHELQNKPVIKIHHNISNTENNMFEIELENGKTIRITGNHKIMLTDGTWKKVEDLDGTEDLEVHGL